MRSALLLTTLVASALAGPTGYRESCPLHCSQDIIFSYQPGRSYEYQYTVSTNTALLGDSEKGAEVTITANAHIDVSAPCDHTLRLTEVRLHGSSHAEEMEAALTRSALRFSFQDGRVEELCAAPTEEAWVLNLKRGVLSAFQTSRTQPGTQEVQETDVQGVCTTHYKNKLEGDILSVHKVKDINSCTKRADLTSYLASAHYNTDSPVQSLPVLDTTSSCRQTVQGGILIDSSCEETHSFRPFSRESGGASTTATNSLKLVSHDGPILTIPEQHFVRKTPVFETENNAAPNTQVETVTALLTQLEKASNNEVRPEAPALFSRLVIALRGLDYPTLSAVNTATTQTQTRKFLVDAMPLVGTAAAAAVVRDMYVNGDLTQEDIDAWFTSLTFLKNPTSDMFTAIAPMLETNPSQAAMLGTSALVNTFCKTKSRCDQDTGVQQVMRRIEAQLGSGCRATNEEQKVKILVALRALGNAGRWVNANHVLHRCYTEDNDMEVRIAAIQAWRHTPCQYDRSNLLALYQDDTQDSEARIAAYLSVMTCPSPTVVATIKDRLTSEGVNQVGSFVWTHLTNLQESAAPGKEWTRALLGEELLANKFNTEALRFSRNYESSFFMKELNLGAAVESNVIFSSKSYLPRSAMLNLTLDLFGESVNLFEVGGRIEGFETYIERLFGPDGYFPEDTVATALQGLRKQKREAETTTLEQFLEEATDEPRGSYYLRLFGNDVHYRHFSGLSGHSEASPSPLALLMELAQGGNVDYTKSYQLLDTHFSVPTVTGLPLTLGAKSTATLALKMDGSFKLQSLSDVHIQGHLRPSAAVHVDGVMLVDAHVTRAGVKVSSTMHTSTSLEGKVRINGGTLVDVSFDTPKDRTEILDLDTKYFYVRDDQDEEKEKEEPVHTRCIHTYMGMNVCGEISIPTSSSSLFLPNTLRAYLTKTDTQTGYTFRYTKTSNEISVLFDNPGARRSLHTALKLQAQDTKVLVSLDSFLMKVEAQGEYMWQPDKKGVKGDVEIDGRHYLVETGLMTPSGNIIKVEPYLRWSANGQDLINIRALAIANVPEHKYSLEANANILRVPPLSFKASLESTTERHLMDMTFSMPTMELNFDLGGKVSCDTSSIKTDVTVEYTKGRRTVRGNSILLLNKEHEGDATTYSSHLTVANSWTDNPIILEYKYTTSPSEFNTFMHFKYEAIDFFIDEKWTHTYENSVRRIKGEVTSKCEFLEVDQHASTEITIEPNAFYLNSVVNRKGGFDNGIQTLLIDLRRDPGTSLTGRFKFEGDDQLDANADFRKVNPGHYTGQVKVVTHNRYFGEMVFVDANTTFKDNSQPGTFDVNVEGSVEFCGRSMSLASDIYGDLQHAKMKLRTVLEGKEYSMNMEATRNSLLLDADVIRHIVVNAKINNDPLKKMLLVNVEWDKETNPNNAFKIEGNIEPLAMAAKFKFMEKEFSVSGKYLNGDLEGEASWSPNQRVAGRLNFSLYGPLSLTANVDTTFPGWEKQSLNINTSLQDNEITCRASATWKNTQQGTLALMGRVQPGGSVYADITLTSTITSLERLSLSFNHQMAGIAITSSLQGSWNDRELNGSLQVAPNDSGVDGLATFTSPFTLPFKGILNYKLHDESMDLKVYATYGSTDLVHLTSTGRLNLDPANHDVDLTFRVTTAVEALPDAKATIKYTLNSSELSLVVDGNAGQRKMMLSVNGNKTVTADRSSISGELRFLTPFTQPFTASLSHTHGTHRFTTQFEMTRFWSTYSFGSLKAHAEGHVHTNDINLSAYISSPETKGSFSFTYKLDNNNLTAGAKMYGNKELLSILVTGTIDPSVRLIQLEGDITSAFEELEMKVKVDSRREGSTQNTQVDLKYGTQHSILSHSFTATGPLNWENVLSLNDHYSLTNKMVHLGDQYQHQAEMRWGDQRLAFDGRFIPVLTARVRKLDAHIGLNTPWECLDNTNIDFHYEKETGGETKVYGEIEYKPGSKIQVTTRNKYNHEGEIFSMGSLTTPFWKPLGYKLNITMRPDKKALLVFTHGLDETTVSGVWECQQEMNKAIFDLVTPSLQYPLHLEGSYLVRNPSKIMNVVAIYHHKYEAQVTFSGSITNTACDLALWEYIKERSDAWRAVHHLAGRWQHQLETIPINVNTALQVDSTTYKADVTLDKTSLKTKMVLNGRDGSLDARWLLQPTNSDLEVVFQSPVDIIKDFNVGLKYDVDAIKGETRMKYDTHEINLLAKMEGQTFVFEGKTPFNGWEVLGASFFASDTAINGYVSRNERKIEVTGTQHLREAKGKVELVITTPYQGYETISFDASYNFHSENKTIKFKTVYGTAEIFAKGVVKMANQLAPKIILNVTTPFSELRTLRASADWNLSGNSKTATAKVIYNEQEFSWNVEASVEGTTHRLMCKATTPYPGWNTASLHVSISASESPYQVRVSIQKENVTKDFSGKLILSNNNLQGEIKTPIPGWEVVALDGTYSRTRDTFSSVISASLNNERYGMETDISFSTMTPKIKIEVTTPYTKATNLKLEMESNLSGSEKTLKVMFTMNEMIFSADATFKLENKMGFFTISLSSPIPGFSTLQVEGNYDLRRNIKKSELNITKEGKRQHFAMVATLDNNHIVLDLATPFPGFQEMKMDADYTRNPGQHLFVADFTRDQEIYNFRGSVEIQPTGVQIKLNTPIAQISRLVLITNYELLNGAAKASIHFERNDDVFTLSTQGHLTPMASYFSAILVTPVPEWNNMEVNLKYKVKSNELTAEGSIQRDDFFKKVSVEASYGPERGSLTVHTPLAGWEAMGAEYMLTMTNNKEATAQVKVIHNNREFSFSAHGRYTQDSIALRFQTPLQGYEESSLKATINVPTNTIKANLQIGSYTFSANGSYTIGNMFLEIATPFPALRFGSIAIKHNFRPGGLEASLTVVHNKENYFLTGEASIGPRSSLILLKTKTPISSLPNGTFGLRYNLDNKAELVVVQLTVGDHSYSLLLGGDLRENLASAKIEMTTPFTGWTQVKVESKIDLTQDDKTIEVVLEREGSIKAISVHGKLHGTDLNFDLRTPFTGLNRVNVSGNVNRSKRSLEFQMMNDAGEASILATFNSVKFRLQTPFARMEEVSFEFKKEGNRYEGLWKRNDNYLKLEITKDPALQTVSVEVKSELQGWEFLALAGRLNHETEEAYAKGQINERKVELAISGLRDDRRRTRNITLDLKTPYSNYQHVTGQLRFSSRRKSIKIESNSSNFKVDMKKSSRSGFQAEVFVPNPTEDTHLQVNLNPYNGNIEFTSRFEILRSLHYKYNMIPDRGDIKMKHELKVSGKEIFNLDFHANAETELLHLDIHLRVRTIHVNLHIHREGFNTFNIILKSERLEDGRSTEKELSMKMNGTGDLPRRGAIDATFHNSFVSVPRTTTIRAEIDRTSPRKHIKLEVTLPGRKLYIIDLNYNINLLNPSSGDFKVRITTPDRSAAPWKNFSGTWDLKNPQQAEFELDISGRKYKGEGTLSLLESNIVISAQHVPERLHLQWKFHRNGNQRDYFLKVGPDSAYMMLKLKGSIQGIERGMVEGGFKLHFQPEELLFTSSWSRDSDRKFIGEGTYTYGQFRGTHKLTFHRDPPTKSATFEFAATSNNRKYSSIQLKGKYDVLDKLVFNAELTINNRVSEIDIDISNFNPRRSRNSVSVKLPFLPPQYQAFHMTLTHDFRNNNNKYIIAEAQIGQKQSHLKAKWKRSDDFSVLEGNLDINSIFIGEVSVGMKYNVANINDAKAEVHYKRVVEGQPEKRVDANWSRKSTSDRLEVELTLDSTFERLQHTRAYATADFSRLFNLNAGLDFNEKHITIVMNVSSEKVEIELTTPFEGFENVKGSITYNLGGKTKNVTLDYERGSRKAHMDLTLNKKTKKKGDLTLDLTTPFEVLRLLKIVARWSKGEATVEYVRNDVRVSMTGTAQLDASKSEFNLSFTAPSGKAVNIAAAYDVKEFITGRGSSPTKLAGLAVDIGETKIKFELKGFRSNERLFVEVDGETSFDRLRNLHLKLDSELNTQQRQGTFEFKVNKFVFNVHNEFERYEDGYYIKSRLESSLTPLPALVFGLGRRGAERIFTLGYGEEKELTFSIKAKNNFRSGFSGSVDIPNFGYDGVQYDVTYRFPTNDQLEIHLEVELGRNEQVVAEFEYNSEGVKARLMSPFTGEHSARIRRSISADSFYSEMGFNDYNLKLRGGFNDNDIKRGAVLEADILGRKFLFNYQLQSEGVHYTEGKLILQTPFRGWEKMGGLFTFSNVNRKIVTRGEAFIPFFLNIPRIAMAADLDYNNNIVGEVTMDVAGEQFILRSNVLGTSLSQGLEGSITLETPFHALPSLEVAGKIKMPSIKNLQADLKITNIYTTYEVDFTYDVTPNQIKADVSILPLGLAVNKISFLLEGIKPTQNKMELRIDNSYLVGEYKIEPSSFIMNVDTGLAGIQRQLSVNTQYSTLDDLEGTVIAILGEERHKVHGALSIASSRMRGEVVLDSSFIGGVRKLEFNATVPDMSFEVVSFNVTFTAKQVHSFSLDLDTRAGVVANTVINTPALPTTTVNLELTWNRAAVTVTTPSATHTAAVSWRQTRRMPSDQIVNAELDTPLLGQRYALRMVMGGGLSKAVLKAEMEVGSVAHKFEANTFMRSTSGGFSLNIQTPFMDIKKAALQGSIVISNIVELQAEASMRDITNTFTFIYNPNKGTLLAEAVSPYIPTGLLKATAEINNAMPNVNLQVALMNAQDVISGRFDMNIPSLQDATVRASISTPLESLKTFNFLIRYQKTDTTHIIVSIDHPITFRAVAKFGNTYDKFNGKLTVKTSIVNFEYVEADLEIPLTEFSPRATLTLPNNKYGIGASYGMEGYLKKASATFYLDDQTYGGNLSIRNKAPYELAYKYNIFRTNSAFHLRTDSSFFTYLL